MSNEAVSTAPQRAKDVKGRLSWVVPAFEAFIIIGYLFLGWRAISAFISSFDLAAFFGNIINAVYFLIGCTIISVVMCFIPVFKSKENMRIAVWNIVWLGFNLFGFIIY